MEGINLSKLNKKKMEAANERAFERYETINNKDVHETIDRVNFIGNSLADSIYELEKRRMYVSDSLYDAVCAVRNLYLSFEVFDGVETKFRKTQQ